MKLLTHNFLSCAAKTCKSSPDSFPLKFEEVELTSLDMDYNPQFLINVLSRVDWAALVKTAVDVFLPLLLPKLNRIVGQDEFTAGETRKFISGKRSANPPITPLCFTRSAALILDSFVDILDGRERRKNDLSELWTHLLYQRINTEHAACPA